MTTSEIPKAVADKHMAAAYRIVHDIPGRMRLRPQGGETPAPAPGAFLLERCPHLRGEEIHVSTKTGSVLLLYSSDKAGQELRKTFAPRPARKKAEVRASAKSPETRQTPRAPVEKKEQSVRNPIPGKIVSILFFPRALRYSLAVICSIPYILRGLRSLVKGKLDLDTLDGAALAVCLLQRDFRSLSSIVFFFALGEFLADWTRKRSRDSLTDSLAIKLDTVWIRANGVDVQIPFKDLREGDTVVINAGSLIPVDGTVVDGEGMVNQASMTGEPLAVRRTAGGSVYAGTILEEGELVVSATRVGNNTRITSILRTIEESESAKASIQGKYEHLADAIVPYNFLLSGAVFGVTRNAARAGSVLLVDYSCAIRLATPLTIFTGMREAAEQGVLIKGGKFMEALAAADVIVFDKTGTLTQAKPSVKEILTFEDYDADAILRLSACLEEHFAHPVGQAVVRAADAKGLKHREEHAKVEYVVAHGIASRWNEKRVLIGSGHFVLEDEGITLTAGQEKEIRKRTTKGLSALYLSIGGKLAGVLCIEDKIRDDAANIVQALHEDGIKRIIMLTGDGPETAAGIARQAGIAEFRSRLLPEDKAAFIADLKKEGHTIIMVGDGINDSPALSAADVGIAMAEGADMAREVADVVLTSGELPGILFARKLSRRALRRVRRNFVDSVAWNSLFLLGGLLGFIMPGVSALLHNATTAALAVRSVRPFGFSRTRARVWKKALPTAGPRPTEAVKPARGKKADSAGKPVKSTSKTPAKTR